MRSRCAIAYSGLFFLGVMLSLLGLVYRDTRIRIDHTLDAADWVMLVAVGVLWSYAVISLALYERWGISRP